MYEMVYEKEFSSKDKWHTLFPCQTTKLMKSIKNLPLECFKLLAEDSVIFCLPVYMNALLKRKTNKHHKIILMESKYACSRSFYNTQLSSVYLFLPRFVSIEEPVKPNWLKFGTNDPAKPLITFLQNAIIHHKDKTLPVKGFSVHIRCFVLPSMSTVTVTNFDWSV